MPITYSIDREDNLITEIWTGRIAAGDLEAYWRRLLSDPEVMAIRRTLVDLRKAEILFTGGELAALVDAVVTPKLAGRRWKTAVVVERPAQFGTVRQYQVFAGHFSSDAIFHDLDDARRWLGEPLSEKSQ